MSSSYNSLIDHDVSPTDAESIGNAIVELLVSERFLLATPNEQCVLNGLGYPPGPRIREIFANHESCVPFWEPNAINGVKVHAERYVNFFAFPQLQFAGCPQCRHRFPDGDGVIDQLYDSVATFVNDDRIDIISCPQCNHSSPSNAWRTEPDIGIAYLGIEFWNWVPFSSPLWTTSIPDLIHDHLGRTMAVSWGKL
ncbi:hypothetical protein FHS27_006525 [Rhodopirellula rubra]|uniref:Uncharacterized protein n=1 Tax=Aporhodopirellula rubra TaxID=980271 RepID=A0A7W5E7D8_9BACT|nr:hypothetical protein [Aporhodopirellula rubra]MBB3210677.1 hypothetical protein [Aporhodopirellula rubra]